jgi:hypothetical protein
MVENAARLFMNSKIFTVGDYILGLPRQSVGELDKLCRFYNRNRISRIHILWLHTFPDLEITRIAEESGMLDVRPTPEKLKEIERKSYLTPDLIFSRTFNQYRTVLLLIRYLPRRWISYILDHRWTMKLMPSIPPIVGSFLVYQFGGEKKFELIRKRLYRRYRHYMLKKLWQWIRLKRSVLPEPPPEPRNQWRGGLYEQFAVNGGAALGQRVPDAKTACADHGCAVSLAVSDSARDRLPPDAAGGKGADSQMSLFSGRTDGPSDGAKP